MGLGLRLGLHELSSSERDLTLYTLKLFGEFGSSSEQVQQLIDDVVHVEGDTLLKENHSPSSGTA